MRPAMAEQLVWYGSSVTTICIWPRLPSSIAALARILIAAATGAVGVHDAGAAEDAAAGREVGTLDELHEIVGRRLGIGEQVHRRVDDFAQVVRRDVGGHADGDALAAVDQQVGEPRRQHRWLLACAVVGRLHVDGLFVDVGQQLHRQRVQGGTPCCG